MQEAVKYSLQASYSISLRDPTRRIPSPIALRRDVRDWFYSRYDYARHHANPVCRAAVAMLRSYRKNHHGELRIPEVKRLAMRIDGELFRIVDGRIRITLQPITTSGFQSTRKTSDMKSTAGEGGHQSSSSLTGRCASHSLSGTTISHWEASSWLQTSTSTG